MLHAQSIVKDKISRMEGPRSTFSGPSPCFSCTVSTQDEWTEMYSQYLLWLSHMSSTSCLIAVLIIHSLLQLKLSLTI